jgi:hypothetical protein
MENEEMLDEEIVFDFQIFDKSVVGEIKNIFSNSEAEIVESEAFSGTELVTLIIPAVAPTVIILLDKLLNFYIQNRKSLRETSIKIGKNEVSLTGFSDEEINALVENGSLEKIKTIVNQK